MKKRLVLMFALTALFVLSMSTGVLAADSFDMTSAVTSTVSELTDKFWAMVAIIGPGILAIVGGKIGVSKGIGWLKSLSAKA